MATHDSISGPEAADRLAIRELVDAYAHCADRRDAKGQIHLVSSRYFKSCYNFCVFVTEKIIGQRCSNRFVFVSSIFEPA